MQYDFAAQHKEANTLQERYGRFLVCLPRAYRSQMEAYFVGLGDLLEIDSFLFPVVLANKHSLAHTKTGHSNPS